IESDERNGIVRERERRAALLVMHERGWPAARRPNARVHYGMTCSSSTQSTLSATPDLLLPPNSLFTIAENTTIWSLATKLFESPPVVPTRQLGPRTLLGQST